jgi:hypothetical protein
MGRLHETLAIPGEVHPTKVAHAAIAAIQVNESTGSRVPTEDTLGSIGEVGSRCWTEMVGERARKWKNLSLIRANENKGRIDGGPGTPSL